MERGNADRQAQQGVGGRGELDVGANDGFFDELGMTGGWVAAG